MSDEPKVLELENFKSDLTVLQKEMITSNLEKQKILMQSSQEGGPTSPLEAILNLMNYNKIGIRRLSKETGVRRKLLDDMLKGNVSMPQDTMLKIISLFEKISPHLFK